MSRYRVEYSRHALKQLKKLDKFQARIILTWIEDNLVDTSDPYRFGKGLVGNRSGEWRYRVGQYRIICLIKDDVLTIHIFEIGHRSSVYDS